VHNIRVGDIARNISREQRVDSIVLVSVIGKQIYPDGSKWWDTTTLTWATAYDYTGGTPVKVEVPPGTNVHTRDGCLIRWGDDDCDSNEEPAKVGDVSHA
jgi:hypothetical protein